MSDVAPCVRCGHGADEHRLRDEIVARLGEPRRSSPASSSAASPTARAVHRPDERAKKRRDDAIVQASRHNSMAASEDVRRLVREDRLRCIGRDSDMTTKLWGLPE